jgi:medium-chain acyl-[acyl-carrier-protein] hydrolase
MRETPMRSATRIVASVHDALDTDLPLVIYGHSMGALLGFELARSISARHANAPAHLVVSGFGSPRTTATRADMSLLTDSQFIARLADLDGTPTEILEDRELMAIMLPVLRADFDVVAGYGYAPGPILKCPITAIVGRDDPEVEVAELEAWRGETSGSCRLVVLPGDHFILEGDVSPILDLISSSLADARATSG